MYRQFKKTLVLAMAALFVVAPLALAVEPLAKPGPKTMQDVGAIQGQSDIVTHGPSPAEPGPSHDTTIRVPAHEVSETTPGKQDVGAVQGQNDIVTHGPAPTALGWDTSTRPSLTRNPEAPKTMQDVGAIQGQSDIVTHGPAPSSSR